MDDVELGRAAIISGGSRGIGAATGVELARRGFDISFSYRNKRLRAEAVAQSIRALGRQALPIEADITSVSDIRSWILEVGLWRSHAQVLVLNASGGLERDLVADRPDYPMAINRDAQIALVEAFLPLMSHGATVVLVTSHWAHLYPDVIQIPEYEVIARSKHAGEEALRSRESYLRRLGVRLVVVTGDMVEGTITAKLLERSSPGLTAGRRAHVSHLPTPEEMAMAIADAVDDSTLSWGTTVVVGGSLASIPGTRTGRATGLGAGARDQVLASSQLLTGEGRNPRQPMTAQDLVSLIDTLEQRGIDIWLDGGWGVDALLAEQTREHDDADLVANIDDAPRLIEALTRAGYRAVEGDPSAHFVMLDDAGRQVDLHMVRFTPDGDGLYRMETGQIWPYPAQGFTGRGEIVGRPVRCLTPEVQILCHAGYAWDDVDHQDMKALKERFHLQEPAPSTVEHVDPQP